MQKRGHPVTEFFVVDAPTIPHLLAHVLGLVVNTFQQKVLLEAFLRLGQDFNVVAFEHNFEVRGDPQTHETVFAFVVAQQGFNHPNNQKSVVKRPIAVNSTGESGR